MNDTDEMDALDRKHADNAEFQAMVRQRELVHQVAMAIRDLREAAHLTQAELAKLCGMKPRAIARLETSQASEPRWSVLDRIARALGREVEIAVEIALGKPKAGRQVVRVEGLKRA